jgi:hypothetical protein
VRPTGSFGADLSFFEIGRQTSDLQALLGLGHFLRCSLDVYILGLFGDLGQDRHLFWRNFGLFILVIGTYWVSYIYGS